MTTRNFRVHNGIDVMGTTIKINDNVIVKDSSGTLLVRNGTDTASANLTAATITADAMTLNGQTAATTDDATALAIALG